MPGYKFDLSQLVMVPNKNQQGRVSGRTEYVDRESEYQVKWLDTDLNVYAVTVKESDLIAAQVGASVNGPLPDFVIDWMNAKEAARREAVIEKAAPVLAAALAKSEPAPRRRCKPRPKASSRRSRPAARSRKVRG